MASRKNIITLPHASLRTRSKKVGYISDEVKKLIKNMESATLDWEDHREHEFGVALAAVQIDNLTRVVIVRHDMENKEDRSFDVFINPKITKYTGDIEEDFEGCLSIKNLYGKVPRHTKVKVTALDENGTEIRLTAEGFLARVFQHEIDHTNGIVYIDHIKDKDAFYRIGEDGKLTSIPQNLVLENPDLWED